MVPVKVIKVTKSVFYKSEITKHCFLQLVFACVYITKITKKLATKLVNPGMIIKLNHMP